MIVALSMLTVGFALSTGAQEKTDKKDDAFDRVTYVNTDNGLVVCFADTVETPDKLNVHNPRDGSHVPIFSDAGQEQDITEPKHGNNICLGGAIFTIDSNTDPFAVDNLETADEWSIWAQEELEAQLLGGQSCAIENDKKVDEAGDKVLCPSGLAFIRSEYFYETDFSTKQSPDKLCVAEDELQEDWWSDVCLEQNPEAASDTTKVAWDTHKFTVCNDIKVDVDNSVLGEDETIVDKPLGDHVLTKHKILFFLSGSDIVLDCFTSSNVQDPIKTIYTGTVVPTVNSVVCSDDPSDPGDDLPNFACFVDPVGDTNCPDRTGTMGTVGTIGTNFGDESAPDYFCNETATMVDHDEPRVLQGTQFPLSFDKPWISTDEEDKKDDGSSANHGGPVHNEWRIACYGDVIGLSAPCNPHTGNSPLFH